MSKLEELIQQLCPDGVEWKKIKDHFTRLRGTAITAGKMKEIEEKQGDVRIFAGGKTVINAFEKDIPNANITRVPSVLVQSRGIIDVVYYEQPFTFKNEMWAYTSDYNVSVKFLFYYLKNNIEDLRQAAIGMGAMPQISLSATEEMFIPLPPLPVQEEIVRLLDQLTETTEKYQAELDVELDARKKQYEKYRDQLLSFDASRTDVEWNILGESCNIIKGEYITKKETTAGNIPVILGGQEPAYYIDKSNHEGKGIVISRSGASAGYVSFWDEPIFVTDGFLVEPKDETLLIEFLYYFLKNKQPYIQSLKRGAGVPHITSNHISDLKVIIPPLDEQERIVNILDRMDKTHKELCKSIEDEIKMRKQQYEYYRNQLLTFQSKE